MRSPLAPLVVVLVALACAGCSFDDEGRARPDEGGADASSGGAPGAGGASSSGGAASAAGGARPQGTGGGAGAPAGGTGGRLDGGAPPGAGGDRDAGDAGGGSGGQPGAHEGLVPVFLAVGYGTRRVVSCDFGVTWPHDESDVPNGGDDGTLVRGLAYGESRFVAAVGGGGVQKLFTTDDAVDFTRLDRGGNGFSDVAYGNGRFVAGGGHVSVVSEDGLEWKDPGTMGSGGILRHLAFGDYQGGRFVAAGDQGRRMNSTDGVTWASEVEEGPGLGGLSYGAGRFVAVSSGSETRYSEDGGDTWKTGSIDGAGAVRGILFDGLRFIVTTASSTYTSANGTEWQAHDGDGGPGALAVSDDGAHYAGADGGDLYHSTDGLRFDRVKQGGQGITRVEFGWVKPSAVCPLPP